MKLLLKAAIVSLLLLCNNSIFNSETSFHLIENAYADDPCETSTADGCASAEPGSGGGCRGCTADGGGTGTVGSGGGNSGSTGGRPGAGGTGNGDGGDSGDRGNNDPEPPETREQCIAKSKVKQTKCYAGPHSLFIDTVRKCGKLDWSSTTAATVGFRIFGDVSGSTTIIVRNYDACYNTADAVKGGLMNDCDIGHAVRVTQCPG